ncbi:type VII secretion integral membrane protein EccD [Streptomyces alkaliterrae]|uniref:Type VII secretion integral membrane protein EccD n=1 Tax=Streptomyces alkaliterrae TaxID=2213162 RepID=A0A5P0YZH7_9ACTN|nr:type VII secretion integral membrane protein EccD [Streptomyces alkaliterrae]MBB1261791.1 type VII secretion integral membrane protein EccD [Streptomyces alkaliterrae]MQS05037.1 type VII secretion integral membrane protein EccD [Streptomyces alkaliterrae]
MTTPATSTTTFSQAPTGTGFSRLTVVAPGGRVDVALPEDVPVAHLYPEIQRLTAHTADDNSLVGYYLVRRDGTVLDAGRTLAGLRIRDGEVLTLRPFSRSLPPAVFDDVSDAVATAVTADRTLWDDRYLRLAGLAGTVVLLWLAALLLWLTYPDGRDMHGLPGVTAAVIGVALLALAPVRGRFYGDRGSATALGLAALPHAMLAGSGVLPLQDGHGVGRLQFLLGCAAVLLAASVMVAALPEGDAPFVAVAVVAGAGTLAAFALVLTDARPLAAASVSAPVAIGLLAFLPALSARFARLPIGYAPPRPGYQTSGTAAEDPFAPAEPGPIDAERIAAQARRGHEVLLGLVGGLAAVAVGAAVVLAFGGTLFGQLLALGTGLALLTRARLFRYSTQVACALAAGTAVLALLFTALALDADGSGLRALWLTTALVAGAAVLAAIAVVVPRAGLTPFWGRLLDVCEGAVLLALTPLCLAVLDVYTTARSMTGR